MRTIARSLCMLACFSASTGSGVEAQLGGVIDVIQKLSGPKLIYYGGTFRVGYQPGQRIGLDLVAELEDARGRLPDRSPPPAESAQVAALGTCVANIGRVVRGMLPDLAYSEARVDRLRAALHHHTRALNRLYVDGRATEGAARSGTLRLAICNTQEELEDLTNEVDPENGFVARFGFFTGYDIDNDDRSDKIYAAIVQTTVEYRFLVSAFNLGVESGYIAHYFHGDISPFWHSSFPLYVNYHPFARNSSFLARNIRIGGGLQFFKPFEAGAFAPVLPDDDEGWESKWALYIGLDFSLSAIPIRTATFR